MTDKEVVVITGATSGIGLELAKLLAKDYALCLIGRSKAKLEEVVKLLNEKYNNPIYYIVADLASSDSIKRVVDEFTKLSLIPVILYNNAGLGDYNYFLDSDIEKQKEIIDVNIKALTELCYYFGNLMKKNQKGTIVNIASIGAYCPGPLMATYYASKAYVLSFSMALHTELIKDHVEVKVASPGPVETAFFQKANPDHNLLEHLKASSPNAVASAIYHFTFKKRASTVISFKNKLGVFCLKFVSYNVASKIIMKIQKGRI